MLRDHEVLYVQLSCCLLTASAELQKRLSQLLASGTRRKTKPPLQSGEWKAGPDDDLLAGLVVTTYLL